MADIKNIEPKFDENGKLDTKQKCCATCKKRTTCDKLYAQHQFNKATNQYAEVILSMYFLCDDYEAMFIEFPILVNGIVSDLAYDRQDSDKEVGKWCVVSVNAEGYDENMHLGIYLGMLPLSIISLYDRKDTTITNKFYPSPAMFVPKMSKVFYGPNMRWKFVETQDDIDTLDKNESASDMEKARKQIKKPT